LDSDVSFSNRHRVTVSWSKPQDPPSEDPVPEVEITTDPAQFTFRMAKIATPDPKQSEAYIATYALFQIFGSSAKEEKVFLKLPPVWRELWSELAETRKNALDSKDRSAVKELRDLVRKRQDQELEDGVILQGAFRGRGSARQLAENGEDSSQDRSKQVLGGPEYYQKLWYDKASSPRFQAMLVSVWMLAVEERS
jgi:ATP-dependent RNA helicase DHX29